MAILPPQSYCLFMSSKKQQIVQVRGQVYVVLTHASNISSLNISTGTTGSDLGGFGTRIAAISDAFEFYRFKRMTLEIFPNRSSTSGEALMGFVSQTPPTTPTTFSQISEMESVSKVISVGLNATFSGTTETQMWHIPPRLLKGGAVQWYKTRDAASDTEWERQGMIFSYHPVATGQLGFIVHYVLELKNPLTTSLTRSLPVELKQQDPAPETQAPIPVYLVQDPNPPNCVPKGTLVAARTELVRLEEGWERADETSSAVSAKPTPRQAPLKR